MGRMRLPLGSHFYRLAKRKRKRLLRRLHSPKRHTLLKELGSSDEVCVFPEKHRGLGKQVIKLILVRKHTSHRPQGCALRKITGCPKALNHEFWGAQPLSMMQKMSFSSCPRAKVSGQPSPALDRAHGRSLSRFL